MGWTSVVMGWTHVQTNLKSVHQIGEPSDWEGWVGSGSRWRGVQQGA